MSPCIFYFLLHFLIIANADEWPPINIFKIMRKSLDVLHIFFFSFFIFRACYLLGSNAGMHFSSPCTMPNNNHHRIISGFASLLSSVILKMLKIGRMRLFRCGNMVCLFTFILPVIIFGAPIYCNIRTGMLTGRLNTSHNLFIFFLPSVSCVYAELACLSPRV